MVTTDILPDRILKPTSSQMRTFLISTYACSRVRPYLPVKARFIRLLPEWKLQNPPYLTKSPPVLNRLVYPACGVVQEVHNSKSATQSALTITHRKQT